MGNGNGYNGYSMSNNAISAYNDGLKPLSKWSKQELLEIVLLINKNIEYKLLNKITLDDLKHLCLKASEWHHTSKMFNRTMFYKVDEKKIVNITNEDLLYYIDEHKKELRELKELKVKHKETKELYICKFLVWGGTRNYPKATEYKEKGEIKGNWFYSTFGKKSINANGFEIVEKVK